MRIKSVHLENYKRFTNLSIQDIPDSARLVVLIGPNGTGKSSLFDAFLLKSRSTKSDYNYSLIGNEFEGYYSKDGLLNNSTSTSQRISNTITIEFHNPEAQRKIGPEFFNIRTAYRNESDFQVTTLERIKPSPEILRFYRIIDTDQAVSENYKRMAWNRMADLDQDAPEDMTFGRYRKESLGELQEAMKDLFSNPTLALQDFGGVRDSGVFRFSKGETKDFHYKNLSGGEKAVFDLLLDIFVKRKEYQDAIYCIDEPEAHVATGLHGSLLEAMLKLLPPDSQLWIATHSVGFVRKASDIMSRTGNVVFLDFSGHDFDREVIICPRSLSRSFWEETYKVALDDLAGLVAPSNIILCEGSKERRVEGFDAKCYNKIFQDDYPDSLFIAQGGSNQVADSQNMVAVIRTIAKGAKVWRLIDRDNMTNSERESKIVSGIHVLSRREIENYLYDPEVIGRFLTSQGVEKDIVDKVLQYWTQRLQGGEVATVDMKKITRDLFECIKKSTGLSNLGNSRDEFAVEYLTSALKQTTVYQELRKEVFS